MIKKLIRWAFRDEYAVLVERINKGVSAAIKEHEILVMERNIELKKQGERIDRHNATVEGWLKAFMDAQGIKP